jgi:hypothetical protein
VTDAVLGWEIKVSHFIGWHIVGNREREEKEAQAEIEA